MNEYWTGFAHGMNVMSTLVFVLSLIWLRVITREVKDYFKKWK